MELVEAEISDWLGSFTSMFSKMSGKYLRSGVHETCGEYQSKVPLDIRCLTSRSETLIPVGPRAKQCEAAGVTGCASLCSCTVGAYQISHGLRFGCYDDRIPVAVPSPTKASK